MNSLERIQAAIDGRPVDRIPMAMWRHFPEDDKSSRQFADMLAAYQKKFSFDLVKVTPSSGYMAEIFGVNFDFMPGKIRKGVRERKNLIVKSDKDWKSVKDIEIKTNILDREIYTIKLLRETVGNETPIFQTVPNALTVARLLRGDGIFEDIKNGSDGLKGALEYINGVIFEFSFSCLRAGAGGIFYFTQLATYDLMNKEEYENFGKIYDDKMLNDIGGEAITIFHIHGMNIMFDLLSGCKAHILNWHDRLTAPSLGEAKKIFKGAVLGGIEEDKVLRSGNEGKIRAQLSDAITQTGGRSLIVGPGCVLPIDVSDEKIYMIKEALRNYVG